eukprot:1963635-Pleurochrysis_carterae.AAC.1
MSSFFEKSHICSRNTDSGHDMTRLLVFAKYVKITHDCDDMTPTCAAVASGRRAASRAGRQH